MPQSNKLERFKPLMRVPPIAAVDHRFFLDENGKDKRLAALPRWQRRKMKAEGNRIAAGYNHVLKSISESGVGYPVDQLVRQLAIEYTHRYASAGLGSQPVSFNYFEAFCDIKLITKSVAPYTYPLPEIDNLFSLTDYINYIASPRGAIFNLSDLQSLPEGKTFHYTVAGSRFDFTFLSAEGREFVVAGFSMARRGNSLHWYLLGGEVHSDQEWRELANNQGEIDVKNIDSYKRKFLSESMSKHDYTEGAPVALEGTTNALRTIITGETDLTSHKHVGRCYMIETENSFPLFCDDPDIFLTLSVSKKAEMIETMHNRVERAAAMWNLAEGMFQLPAYFDFKIGVQKSLAVPLPG